MKNRLIRILIGVTAAGLLLAACSGDDSSDGGEAAPGTTNPPVRHHELTEAEIAEYQTDLDAVGCWAGPVDGILGPRTEAALREFQEAEGITVTGLFGGVSQGALTAAAQAGETVCGGGEATETAERTVDDASIHELEVWQHDLILVGCYSGAEDGVLGPQTESAIRAYQEASGLTVDGRLGPQTEEALAESAAEGGQICHAPAATSSSGTDAPDDGGGALDGAADPADDGGGAVAGANLCQVNSAGTWPTQQQANNYVAQLQAAGFSGFGTTQGQGGVVVLRSGLPEQQAVALLARMNQAGFSGRYFCDV